LRSQTISPDVPRVWFIFLLETVLNPPTSPPNCFFLLSTLHGRFMNRPSSFYNSAFYGTQLAVFNYFSQYDHERTAMRLARRIQQLGYQVEIHKAA
jgi:hypothetical protein